MMLAWVEAFLCVLLAITLALFLIASCIQDADLRSGRARPRRWPYYKRTRRR